MASRFILQLINETIIPALLVVTAKLVGIVLTMLLFGISWSVNYDSAIPRITFYSSEDFITVSSWSSFFVVLVIAVGLLWLLVRAHVFHDTHVTPQLTLRLLNLDLTHFLTTTVEISRQAVIWLSYLWLLIILSVVQAYFGYFYWWMIIFSVLAGILLTWSFIVDIERETEGF